MASRMLVVAFLLATASTMAAAQKAAPAPAKAKPAPAAPAADAPGAATADGKPPTDPIAIMKKVGGFSTFIELLETSRVDTQLKAQLTDSYNGLTIIAPTDAAFDALKAGTLNGLSNQDQIQMMLYCVLPRFYSLSMLSDIKGKVNTQATGHRGPFKYTIKPSNNNVNVSTGVKGNNMLLGSVLSKDFPCAIYSVDKVPLPYELFGPQPPTPAPAPAPAPLRRQRHRHQQQPGQRLHRPRQHHGRHRAQVRQAARRVLRRQGAAAVADLSGGQKGLCPPNLIKICTILHNIYIILPYKMQNNLIWPPQLLSNMFWPLPLCCCPTTCSAPSRLRPRRRRPGRSRRRPRARVVPRLPSPRRPRLPVPPPLSAPGGAWPPPSSPPSPRASCKKRKGDLVRSIDRSTLAAHVHGFEEC